jgi:hypothetical protein
MRVAGHVTCMGVKGSAQSVWQGSLNEDDQQEDLDVSGRIILKYILEQQDGGAVDWIYLAQERNKWQALVNMLKNFSFP